MIRSQVHVLWNSAACWFHVNFDSIEAYVCFLFSFFFLSFWKESFEEWNRVFDWKIAQNWVKYTSASQTKWGKRMNGIDSRIHIHREEWMRWQVSRRLVDKEAEQSMAKCRYYQSNSIETIFFFSFWVGVRSSVLCIVMLYNIKYYTTTLQFYCVCVECEWFPQSQVKFHSLNSRCWMVKIMFRISFLVWCDKSMMATSAILFPAEFSGKMLCQSVLVFFFIIQLNILITIIITISMESDDSLGCRCVRQQKQHHHRFIPPFILTINK